MTMRTSPQGTNQPYQTADLYYAAYLRVAGIPYLGETVDDRKVFFQFEDSPNLDDLRLGYFNNTGKVAALQYKREIVDLKAMTHEALRRANRR